LDGDVVKRSLDSAETVLEFVGRESKSDEMGVLLPHRDLVFSEVHSPFPPQHSHNRFVILAHFKDNEFSILRDVLLVQESKIVSFVSWAIDPSAPRESLVASERVEELAHLFLGSEEEYSCRLSIYSDGEIEVVSVLIDSKGCDRG
jgi:hypothetical protein